MQREALPDLCSCALLRDLFSNALSKAEQGGNAILFLINFQLNSNTVHAPDLSCFLFDCLVCSLSATLRCSSMQLVIVTGLSNIQHWYDLSVFAVGAVIHRDVCAVMRATSKSDDKPSHRIASHRIAPHRWQRASDSLIAAWPLSLRNFSVLGYCDIGHLRCSWYQSRETRSEEQCPSLELWRTFVFLWLRPVVLASECAQTLARSDVLKALSPLDELGLNASTLELETERRWPAAPRRGIPAVGAGDSIPFSCLRRNLLVPLIFPFLQPRWSDSLQFSVLCIVPLFQSYFYRCQKFELN